MKEMNNSFRTWLHCFSNHNQEIIIAISLHVYVLQMNWMKYSPPNPANKNKIMVKLCRSHSWRGHVNWQVILPILQTEELTVLFFSVFANIMEKIDTTEQGTPSIKREAGEGANKNILPALPQDVPSLTGLEGSGREEVFPESVPPPTEA